MANPPGFCTLSLLMALAAPVALAQPAPESAKEQRQASTLHKKMPAAARPPDPNLKREQRQAKDRYDHKMTQAETERAVGASSASQGIGGSMTQSKKPSSPATIAKSASKPVAQPQSGELKK